MQGGPARTQASRHLRAAVGEDVAVALRQVLPWEGPVVEGGACGGSGSGGWQVSRLAMCGRWGRLCVSRPAGCA